MRVWSASEEKSLLLAGREDLTDAQWARASQSHDLVRYSGPEIKERWSDLKEEWETICNLVRHFNARWDGDKLVIPPRNLHVLKPAAKSLHNRSFPNRELMKAVFEQSRDVSETEVARRSPRSKTSVVPAKPDAGLEARRKEIYEEEARCRQSEKKSKQEMKRCMKEYEMYKEQMKSSKRLRKTAGLRSVLERASKLGIRAQNRLWLYSVLEKDNEAIEVLIDANDELFMQNINRLCAAYFKKRGID